jgi:hypothetical protein
MQLFVSIGRENNLGVEMLITSTLISKASWKNAKLLLNFDSHSVTIAFAT